MPVANMAYTILRAHHSMAATCWQTGSHLLIAVSNGEFVHKRVVNIQTVVETSVLTSVR